MTDITNAESVAVASLCDLRNASNDAVRQLPEPISDIYQDARIAAHRRSEKIRALELIEEFTAPMCGHFDKPIYELAFKPKWNETNTDIYQARWWINEFNSGVYFIYDSDDELQYIGSAYTGALGNRIYHTNHREYTESVDVVLFDRRWCHYSLAFEALAISRLTLLHPLRNRQFANLWIEPYPPWNEIWNRQYDEE